MTVEAVAAFGNGYICICVGVCVGGCVIHTYVCSPPCNDDSKASIGRTRVDAQEALHRGEGGAAAVIEDLCVRGVGRSGV